MPREEIVGGLRNAIDRGSTIDQAVSSFINSGYNEEEVHEAAKLLSQGVSSTTVSQQSTPKKIPQTSPHQPVPSQANSQTLSQPNQPQTQIKQLPNPKHIQDTLDQLGVSNKKPFPLKIISLFYNLTAILSILSALVVIPVALIIIFGLESIISNLGLPIDFPLAGASLALLLVGVFLLAPGVFSIIVSRAIKKRKKWSRIITIIISALIIMAIVSLAIIEPSLAYTSPTIYILGFLALINLLIFFYLIFSRKVKDYYLIKTKPKKHKPEKKKEKQLSKAVPNPVVAQKKPPANPLIQQSPIAQSPQGLQAQPKPAEMQFPQNTRPMPKNKRPPGMALNIILIILLIVVVLAIAGILVYTFIPGFFPF